MTYGKLYDKIMSTTGFKLNRDYIISETKRLVNLNWKSEEDKGPSISYKAITMKHVIGVCYRRRLTRISSRKNKIKTILK